MKWSLSFNQKFICILCVLFVVIVLFNKFVLGTDQETFVNIKSCINMTESQRLYAIKQCSVFDSNPDNCAQTVDSIICAADSVDNTGIFTAAADKEDEGGEYCDCEEDASGNPIPYEALS